MLIKDIERIIKLIKEDKHIETENKDELDINFTEGPHSITINWCDRKVNYEMIFKNSKQELI